MFLLCVFWFTSCWDVNENTYKEIKNNNTTMEKQSIASIRVDEFIEKSKGDFIVIDIRTPQEVAEWKIEEMDLNLDYYASDFVDQLNALDKNKKYLIYCRSGSRTYSTLLWMRDLWFQEAYDLEGGIISWIQSGENLIK